MRPGQHAWAMLSLLRLDTRRITDFDNSPQTARHALQLLWLIIPLRIFAAYAGEHVIIENYLQYWPVRTLQVTLATLLPLPLIWLFVRSQNLTQRFPLYVTTYLWLSLYWAIFSAVMNGATMHVAFEVNTLKAIGTTLFLIGYASYSYMAWLSLRCNPFIAVGVATIASLCVALTSDISGILLFGSPRPLIGE